MVINGPRQNPCCLFNILDVYKRQVEENILLPLLLDGKKPNPKRLAQILSILGLEDRKEHLPSQLSGGQQQRVSVGRALITHPAVILADEPTGLSLIHI